MKREEDTEHGHLLGDIHLLLKGDLFLISRLTHLEAEESCES